LCQSSHERREANEDSKYEHVRPVITIHGDLCQPSTHVLHCPDQRLFYGVIFAHPVARLGEELVADATVVVGAEQNVVSQRVRWRRLFAKHVWHGRCKDTVAETQPASFLHNLELWIALVREALELLRHALPAAQQIFQC
jgi:hypothetical protein